MSQKRLPIIACVVLAYVAISLCVSIFSHVSLRNLSSGEVAFLDVGQGDAIYIQAPNGHDMLIDGGRDQKILSVLKKETGTHDNWIDVVIATHPDADHVGGLPSVLSHYGVGSFIHSVVPGNTKTYSSLLAQVDDLHIEHMMGVRGTRIVLDSKTPVVFEIFSPVYNQKYKDTNSASVVGKLTYGKDSVFLTGDAPQEIEKILVGEDGIRLQSDILKLGHHGSRTASSEIFLQTVKAHMAIISAGLNNSYGHPHKEVISLLSKLQIPYSSTIKEGTIVYMFDENSGMLTQNKNTR